MTTLLDLDARWREIERLLDESEGEVTPEIEAAMAEWNLDEADKVDGYIYAIKDLEDRADLAKRQAADLYAKGKAIARRAAWLEARLAEHMAQRGVREVRGQTFRAQFQKNGGKAPLEVLVDPKLLPVFLQKYHEPEADKMLLATALDDPEHPYHVAAEKYARFGERGESLRFY